MSDSKTGKDKFTKKERSWILYDWANSVYATIMMAAVFPVYFTGLVNGTGNAGDYWWGIGTSLAMVAAAVLAPVIGAFADYHGNKKRLFTLFWCIGIIATALCAATNSWVLLLIAYGLSQVGFSSANLVYDSFLSDVTTRERMDKVSAWGFSLGYIGGSTIPFIISIALIQFGKNFGIDTVLAIKISVIMASVWWGVFTIPFFKNVKHEHSIDKPDSHIIKNTFIAIGVTAKKIFKQKGIFYFLLAYFFYIDGVGTIIKMSTSYGATLGLNSTLMIVALLVTQLVAFPCAILFARLSKKFGSLNMLITAVIIYLFITMLGFVMGFGLEFEFFGTAVGIKLFWTLAVLVGMVQGGIQAVSRSYFAKLVPPQNSGEFFGFFDIFGKFAAVMGPALYALTKGITGKSSLSIASIILLFLIAIIILVSTRQAILQSSRTAGSYPYGGV
jgi:UMF1 family MFS transporter